MKFSTFTSEKDNTAKVVQKNIMEFERYLQENNVARPKKSGPAWSPAIFRDDIRKNANVISITALVYDIDTPSGGREINIEDCVWIWHSTYSGKGRIIVPLRTPKAEAEWSKLFIRFAKRYAINFDPATKDPARLFYLPSYPPEPDFEPLVKMYVPNALIEAGAPP